MVPDVGCSCSRMSLAVVVLPQPDSPIRPSVSPAAMEKLTPSTAFTQPVLRLRIAPVPTGKYLRKLSSSSSGAVMHHRCSEPGQPASGCPPWGALNVLGILRRAVLHHLGATWVKGAAGWRACQIGRLARNGIEWLLASELGHGAQECFGVGVFGGIEQVAHSPHFHDPAGIHDCHAIAHLGDDAEIVRDENECDTGLLLNIHEQV